jgi:mannose-6-phosphate isomerase-like protein (cupin superfamily)
MVHVVAPTEGEVIDLGPIRLRIIEDGTHTDHRVAVVEGTLSPGSSGPPQHIHREHDETFHVVSGTVRFTCGDKQVDAGPGTTVTAPIGVPHTFANPGDVPAVFIGTLTPDLYVQYFRDLREIPWGPSGPDPVAVGEVMARYATEVVPPR